MTRAHTALSGAAVLVLTVGIAIPSKAATTLQLQVSPALQENWSSSLNAAPGASIDIRLVVSWTGGAQTPLGLASFIAQPTVSNFGPADTFTPLVNNGVGSQTTTPAGAVNDVPGGYGRVRPFAATDASFTGGENFVGHRNMALGVQYLRIAQRRTTSWFGGSGNTTGGAGVLFRQWSQAGADRQAIPLPAFSSQLTGIVVFKFNIILSAAASQPRTLVADLPLAGINAQPNPYIAWWATPAEPTGSIRDLPTIIPAFINVPAPGPAASLLAFAVWRGTRRRRDRSA